MMFFFKIRVIFWITVDNEHEYLIFLIVSESNESRARAREKGLNTFYFTNSLIP